MEWLAGQIIFHDATADARRVGQLSLFDVIPPSKSLSSTRNRTGLPIGNYTSQFFANVYLDRLDQFAKHQLKVKYYIRYVDDLVLVHENPRQLEAWETAMGSFVERELALRLHPSRRRLEPVSNGCDFLGYVVRRTHLLPRRRTVQNCREKLRQHQKLLVTRTETTAIYRYPEREVSQLFATLMSYQGQIRHASVFRIWRGIFDEFPYLRFYVNRSGDSWIRNDGTPRRFGSLAAQY
jgi:RNA-directed DNA polymerase